MEMYRSAQSRHGWGTGHDQGMVEASLGDGLDEHAYGKVGAGSGHGWGTGHGCSMVVI